MRFTERFAEAHIQLGVGAGGGSYDSALAETIIGRYKTELIKTAKSRRTVENVEIATACWVDCLNHRRLDKHSGDIPSVELESADYAQRRAVAIG